MLKFLALGLFRDKSRWLFPALIVLAGAMITVIMHGWLNGALETMVETNAAFSTGHVKIMTKAYQEISDQMPNDLALLGISKLQQNLKNKYPNMYWTPRIKFGGLLDIPDKNDETKAQGPVFGFAVDLFSPQTKEYELLNLKKALVSGKLPAKPNEILISAEYAQKLGVKIGDQVTLISSTMDGSMAIYNLLISGTLNFGIEIMDRSAIIADIHDIQTALNMPDGASEILGFAPNLRFNDKKTITLSQDFNAQYLNPKDKFSPIMLPLRNQADMGVILNIWAVLNIIISGVFVVAMSLVLWNSGLMASLRRYGEIGVRLAIGESKGSVYRSLIIESILIGLVGSFLGTALGLLVTFYLQEVGVDISNLIQGSQTIFANVFRARITPPCFYIGFIPGVLASVLGTMISGIGIYKRNIAQLFAELQA